MNDNILFKAVNTDMCPEFRQAQNSKWRTHIFIREFLYEPDKIDITLVAQLSVDRVQMIEELCKHWEGATNKYFLSA